MARKSSALISHVEKSEQYTTGRTRRVVVGDWGKNGGVVDYVVLSGRARITAGGAPELLQQLARVYLGPGIKYPSSDHAPAGYITHIQIERVYGQGSWKTAGNKREGEQFA